MSSYTGPCPWAYPGRTGRCRCAAGTCASDGSGAADGYAREGASGGVRVRARKSRRALRWEVSGRGRGKRDERGCAQDGEGEEDAEDGGDDGDDGLRTLSATSFAGRCAMTYDCVGLCVAFGEAVDGGHGCDMFCLL